MGFLLKDKPTTLFLGASITASALPPVCQEYLGKRLSHPMTRA